MRARGGTLLNSAPMRGSRLIKQDKPQRLLALVRSCYPMLMGNSYSQKLTILEELGGYRHHLDGQPIHAGDVLEYFDENRLAWVPTRFELIFGTRGRQAVLCLPDDSCLALTDTIRLRWPSLR